ncbi:phosphoheptose isomerase [Clostridia bacterium]|nr:phosphoheptose isomerase [Clostridia bacterium]
MHKHLEELINRYPKLAEIKEQIEAAYHFMSKAYDQGKKLLIAGNGGSSADSDHMVGELMKGFVLPRAVKEDFTQKLLAVDEEMGKELSKKLQGALPAISLSNHFALTTAYLNDIDGLSVFAQQVYGYGQAEDVFLGISTSGNSRNVLLAAVTAKAKGLKVIALSGKDGGKLANLADVSVIAPEEETYKIQELHLPIYHTWCLMLESQYFS